MLGSNASAVHVIGSQIEAMTMRVEEIKRKGIADTQKFNTLKKRRAQQDVEISQLKSRLEDMRIKESEAKAKLHAAEARKNAQMEFIHEHEERSRQGKEAVEVARVAALMQRRHYIEQMQESSTHFLAAAADCDKENLVNAINSLQITLDARKKAQEEQNHPAHRAKVAKLSGEVVQMREQEKSLLQELDREKARMDAAKRHHGTFALSLLQASMGGSAKKLECHAPSPPLGALYQTYEVDWNRYRASIRSAQHTLQDLWRNTFAKNGMTDHTDLKDENAEEIANVSRSLEALCVSTLRHHANEALAVAVSPDDAYGVLLHELDKLCRLYVVLHVEKERREHLGRGEQRDSEADMDLCKDNSLISSFSFASDVTDEMKAVIFDPYAVADEDNAISPYHRQMRVELAELIKQTSLYGYHGDATAPRDVETLSFDGPTSYGEFNAPGVGTPFDAENGDTVLTSWSHSQFETVEMEIAALFSCMVENDDYWQSVKTLLKDIYEMNEHMLEPVGDQDDEEDTLDGKGDRNTRTDGVDTDNNKRKRELEDEGVREPPHHHTGEAVMRTLSHPRQNARSGATTPPVVDAEQGAAGEDVAEEGQSKVSYYCTACNAGAENEDELNEWTEFVDTLLLTNDGDVPGGELKGESVRLDTMSKRYTHLMRSLLSVPTDELGYSLEEDVATNTVAVSFAPPSSATACAIPPTPTASTPSSAICGANLRESTCNMLNDFMVWLDEQIGEAQELERGVIAGPSAENSVDGIGEYNFFHN